MYILCIPDIYIYIITRYYLSTYCWVIHQIFPDARDRMAPWPSPPGTCCCWAPWVRCLSAPVGSLIPRWGKSMGKNGGNVGKLWEKYGFTLWLCQNSYWKWSFIVSFAIKIWQCVKTLYPFCSHENSWDLWMFIPLKMVLIGIDPTPYGLKWW